MGLDVNIRYVRTGAVPDISGEYNDDDVRNLGYFFNGRFEFRPLQQWVGNERYGKFIPITQTNYEQLEPIIRAAIVNRVDDGDYDLDDVITTDTPTQLIRFYQLLMTAPLYWNIGWCLEVECDW